MNLAQWIAMGVLRVYQCAVSPVLHALVGPSGGCRFHPTCSEYAREAMARHGVGRGAWLTAKRLCKCQPWGPCGEDLVPEVGRLALRAVAQRRAAREQQSPVTLMARLGRPLCAGGWLAARAIPPAGVPGDSQPSLSPRG